jgi:chemosensory pili system protein ChpA (sensor histidine kinase/response regulator)
MEANDPFTTTCDALFVPLQEALHACESDCGDLQEFGGLCRQTSEVLRDIGEEEAALLTETLGLLSEMGGDLSAGDGDDDPTRQVLDFLRTGVETLQQGLNSEGGAAAGQFAELIDQAEQQWGGPLQWLREGDVVDSAMIDRTSIDCADADEADNWDGSPAEASGQVDLILSALGGGGGGSDSASTTERDQKPSGKATPRQSTTSRTPAVQQQPATPSPAASTAAAILDAELLEAYLEDANLCLASMERAVLEFENDPTSEDPVLQLCRELHTLKGASASVGFNELAAQLHDVEEQLERQLSDSSQVPVDLVMNCVDAVRAQIATLQSGGSATNDAPTAAVPTLCGEGSDAANTLRVRTSQLDRLMDLLADVVIWRSRREERLTELDTASDELARCVFRLQAMEDRLRERGPRHHAATDEAAAQSTSYVTELSNDMREIAQQLAQTRQQVAAENRAVSQFIQEFRQELVQIRRVPLAGLFQRLHRSIREAARLEGREVRLEIHGEQTGLERSLQEKLYEPLLHLVRNAVSHGIEPPEERIKAGKPAAGTVTLDAYGSPHVLIIEVRDDGKGLDYDAIRRRGLERGFLLADRPVSRAELARLIFRPGFSTKETTNELSGRGVGMNVVEEALDRCQCHIETESEPGCGTCFRLTIPLRSVIEHTLMFRCGGQSFALPMQFVKSAARNSDDVQPTSGDTAHRLADLLRLPASEAQRRQHWIEIADRLTSRITAGAARRLADEHRICLGVDEILGPEEVVVRPLPPLLRRHPHLCGMTLSGAGEVVLLLDGRRLLMDAAAEDESGATGASQHTSPQVPDEQDEVHVLVVDDSLSARRRLVQKLRAMGLGITEAADGVEAVDLLRNGTFDAVFSDLEMPRLGGFDLLAEMSSLPDPPPCVIVTTRTEQEIQERARTLGAAGFLSKPVETAAVEQMVDRLQLTTRVSQTGDE